MLVRSDAKWLKWIPSWLPIWVMAARVEHDTTTFVTVTLFQPK